MRMAGLYLVGAWLILQVTGTLLPMFGAPDIKSSIWLKGMTDCSGNVLDFPGLRPRLFPEELRNSGDATARAQLKRPRTFSFK